VELDKHVAVAGSDAYLAFGGGVDGAQDLLGAIAGSTITVTGLAFSLTMVALQLASTQYSPRALLSFTADRSNQVVMGILIGTFTYSLLVLRVVRSSQEDLPKFVPSIAVAVAMRLPQPLRWACSAWPP
jgi:uncharacterized membrane protein